MTSFDKDMKNMFGSMGNSLKHFSLDEIGNAVMNVAGSAGKVYNAVVNPYDREDTAYLRNLQQTIFEREDNATQRKVADLEKAGLSPILATGAGANAGQAINARHEGEANPLEAVNFYMGMKQNMANLSRTKAEQERINLQNEIDTYNLAKAKELGVTTTAANTEWASIANAIFAFLGWSDPDGGDPAPGDTGKIPLLSAMGSELSNLFTGNFTPNPRSRLSDEVAEAMVADFKNYNDYERAVRLRNGNPVSFDDWFNLRTYKYGNMTPKKEMEKNYDSSSLPVATKGYVPPGWNGTR